MTQHDDTLPNRPIACADMKAALSAYIDDELSRDERLRADAHLVGCGKCRDLVERAENLDETLREQFALDLERAATEIAPASVDTLAMQSNVFAVLGLGDAKPAPARRWLPRAAIAAGLAGAVLATFAFWNAGRQGATLAPHGPGEFSGNPRDTRGVEPVPAPSSSAAQLAALDPDERQLLYSTGVILTNLRKDGFERSTAAVQLREVARYDELVDRLDALLSRVPQADRPTVALAREAIEFLIDSSEDPIRWEEIRRDMERTDLDHKVEALGEV